MDGIERIQAKHVLILTNLHETIINNKGLDEKHTGNAPVCDWIANNSTCYESLTRHLIEELIPKKRISFVCWFSRNFPV